MLNKCLDKNLPSFPMDLYRSVRSHSFEEARINKARNAREQLHLWGMAPQFSSWDQYLRFRLTGAISLQVSREDSNAL